jgi:hypothetical protein
MPKSITPKAIQDLLDELKASKQSRLRAWNVLQRLRLVLSESGNIATPPPAQKTFHAEGEVLEHALTKSFRIGNESIKSLRSSVRRFRDATINSAISYDCLTQLGGILGKLSRLPHFRRHRLEPLRR